MDLIPITEAGEPATPIHELSECASEGLVSTAQLYRTSGFHPPWVGYLAIEKGTCNGTCAFKSPPADGQVNIACCTFPGHEGRAVAPGWPRN